MRTVLLLVMGICAIAAAELPRKAEKAMKDFAKDEAAIVAEFEAAKAKYEADMAEAKQALVKDLLKSIGRRDSAVEQMAVYKEVLRVDNTNEKARAFFEAMGTLENVLVEVGGVGTHVTTDMMGEKVVVQGEVDYANLTAEQWDKLPGKIIEVDSKSDPVHIYTLKKGEKVLVVPHPIDTWQSAIQYPKVTYKGDKGNLKGLPPMGLIDPEKNILISPNKPYTQGEKIVLVCNAVNKSDNVGTMKVKLVKQK